MYNFRYFTQVFPFWLTGYYLWRVTNLIESSAFLIHWLYQKKKNTPVESDELSDGLIISLSPMWSWSFAGIMECVFIANSKASVVMLHLLHWKKKAKRQIKNTKHGAPLWHMHSPMTYGGFNRHPRNSSTTCNSSTWRHSSFINVHSKGLRMSLLVGSNVSFD